MNRTTNDGIARLLSDHGAFKAVITGRPQTQNSSFVSSNHKIGKESGFVVKFSGSTKAITDSDFALEESNLQIFMDTHAGERDAVYGSKADVRASRNWKDQWKDDLQKGYQHTKQPK